MKKKIVLKSISNTENNLCVDIFQRDDGSFGFEEYRRDVESNEGWFKTGFYENYKFKTQEEAYFKAKEYVDWLKKKNI